MLRLEAFTFAKATTDITQGNSAEMAQAPKG